MNGLLKFGDLSSAESLQKDMQPLEVAPNQGVQDLFVKELHNIVDVFAQKDCHSELDGPVFLLLVW